MCELIKNSGIELRRV